MGFSITSAVFGGTLIICYSIAIAELRRKTYTDTSSDDNKEYSCEYHAELVICTMILILGVCEFAVEIWAAVCCCLIKPCTCCYSNPVLQVSIATGTTLKLYDTQSCQECRMRINKDEGMILHLSLSLPRPES